MSVLAKQAAALTRDPTDSPTVCLESESGWALTQPLSLFRLTDYSFFLLLSEFKSSDCIGLDLYSERISKSWANSWKRSKIKDWVLIICTSDCVQSLGEGGYFHLHGCAATFWTKHYLLHMYWWLINIIIIIFNIKKLVDRCYCACLHSVDEPAALLWLVGWFLRLQCLSTSCKSMTWWLGQIFSFKIKCDRHLSIRSILNCWDLVKSYNCTPDTFTITIFDWTSS